VQQVHRIAEQDLGLEVGLRVRRDEVVQVDRERRVADPIPRGVARRQAGVAPAGFAVAW
jgi:hypothetical protein